MLHTRDKGLKKEFISVSRTRLQFETTRSTTTKQPACDTPFIQKHKSFRAARLVGDGTRFLIVSAKDDKVTRELMDEIVQNGMKCGRDRYTWLGYSESNLKSSQFLLFKEDAQWTVPKLLKSLGDLPAVYLKSGYGKYAARLGLSFSSTVEALEIPKRQMVQIPDKEATDGTLVTDGVGLIKESLAREIISKLDLPENTAVFQCRLGGIKGVFTVYPDEDFDEIVGRSGKSLAFRDSMLKYKSEDTHLELCGISRRAQRGRLWIHGILLLLSLGVPIPVFEEILQEQLERIDLFMRDRRTALDILESSEQGELDADGNGFHQDLYEMLLAGHDLDEPYLNTLMDRFQSSRYKALREKLSIDVQKSTRLYGVVDEYGVLKEDEVYINIDMANWRYGKVLVTRNPGQSPGDIRMLNAVNRPELAHLKNCIVFPSKCQRSVPDMMSGGDLDGDTYWICWDERLFPPRIEPPEERGESASMKIDRDLKDMPTDAAETFANMRDNGKGLVGKLCSLWEKVSKQSKGYAGCKTARSLVPLIEEAMDMLKKGTDVAVLQEKFNKLSRAYYSKKGQKEEQVPDVLQHFRKLVPYSEKSEKLEVWPADHALDIRHQYPDEWATHYKEAGTLMKTFNRELKDAIGKDDADSDGESESGKATYANMLTEEWKEKHFSGRTSTDHQREFVRASAWYIRGYESGKQKFAWLGARYLNTLKAAATRDGRLPLPVGNRDRPLSSASSSANSSSKRKPQRTPEPPPASSSRQAPASSSSYASGSQTPPFSQASSSSSSASSKREARPQSPPPDESATARPRRSRSPSPPPQPDPSSSRSRSRTEQKGKGRAEPPPASSGASSSSRQQPQEPGRRENQHQQYPPGRNPQQQPSPDEPLLDANASTNPKPMRPVATNRSSLPRCTSRGDHDWKCKWGNGTARHYICKLGCEVLVKEKKVGGFWVPAT